MQSGRLKQSITRPTNYAQLNDLWNQHLRYKNQTKASIKPKRRFACKINIRSDTPQNYQETIQYTEKNHWIEAMKEEFDLHQINKT